MQSRIVFENVKLKESMAKLAKSTSEEKKLYEWLVRAFEDLEKDAFCGVQIPKSRIPKEYKNKCDNLWKYNLPNAWRIIYTVKSEKIILLSIILEWFSHKDYERRFKY